MAIPLPYVEPWQPEPLYGHVDAFNYGQVAGVVAGVATSITVGVVASGGVGVLHAGVTLTKAAQLYTVATTVGGAVTAGLHVYDTGKVGIGDALVACSDILAELAREPEDNVRWALANALTVVADESMVGEIKSLLEDARYNYVHERLKDAVKRATRQKR